jgi:YD repeat-containing protein
MITGHLSTLTAPGSEIAQYAYEAANNPTAVTWPDGSLCRYRYEDMRLLNALTRVTDELGTRIGNCAHDSLAPKRTERLLICQRLNLLNSRFGSAVTGRAEEEQSFDMAVT